MPEEDSRCAEEIAQASGSNLAFALRCLPKERREGMTVFYAFCRCVDDLADDPGLSLEDRKRGLNAWRRFVLGDQGPSSRFQEEMEAMMIQFPIDRALLTEIIQGMEMDLEPVDFPTYADLEAYCYRVASAVGLVSIVIFGCTMPRTKSYAVELGHALQLTNIIRDVGEDLECENRVYLPLDDLDRFGLTRSDLESCRSSSKFRSLMEFEAERAEQRFRAALDHLTSEDRPRLVASEGMRLIYHQLLQEMKRDGFRVFEKRYRLSKLQKMACLFRAWTGWGSNPRPIG